MSFTVTILGSASAKPTPGRHPSAQVVNLHEQHYLVDAGEGTQQQLFRYGINPLRLRAVFLSHLHGDHCFGLFPLLSTLGLYGRRTPLPVYAPAPFGEILACHLRYFDSELPYAVEWHEVDTTCHRPLLENRSLEVWSIPLRHRVPTCGYLFREKEPPLNVDKFKITKYGLSIAQITAAKRGEAVRLDSGETLPNEELTYRPYKARSYAYLSDTAFSAKAAGLAAGVDLGVLYGELTTLLGGAYINNFSRFGKLYQTYIQAAPEYRLDKRSLDNYYVASSSGESVPVSSFVEVVDTVGVEYVSQFNLYRSISLTVTPAARASTTTVMQEITRTAGEVLPDDIGTAWSGTSYQEANASKTGGLVYLLALVFVFLALAALYESWGLPLAILMSVPVAVLGAVLFIGGSHLLDAFFVNDVYMQISLVMLIGLAAKNAILVVEYADRLFNEKGLSLMDAAIGAAKLRVRPIIMTAFAFILGVMPLVFASGVYATARNIMGVALVGGMLFATLLGIFVYPALYYFVGRIGNFERRRERKKQEEKL